ncbi:hypothetical protein Y032_0005g2581 [Ancylostoma ceylanicum]|uniref:Uncharacterized protein n=1 Tax=Ancylostoma ceylanicum TaxID=53326 RepID=A0A016VSD6_9BILA|nr:hypothetical protein Y032_0005g2581 [Ancylostoma ceylanicum]
MLAPWKAREGPRERLRDEDGYRIRAAGVCMNGFFSMEDFLLSSMSPFIFFLFFWSSANFQGLEFDIVFGRKTNRKTLICCRGSDSSASGAVALRTWVHKQRTSIDAHCTNCSNVYEDICISSDMKSL